MSWRDSLSAEQSTKVTKSYKVSEWLTLSDGIGAVQDKALMGVMKLRPSCGEIDIRPVEMECKRCAVPRHPLSWPTSASAPLSRAAHAPHFPTIRSVIYISSDPFTSFFYVPRIASDVLPNP